MTVELSFPLSVTERDEEITVEYTGKYNFFLNPLLCDVDLHELTRLSDVANFSLIYKSAGLSDNTAVLETDQAFVAIDGQERGYSSMTYMNKLIK